MNLLVTGSGFLALRLVDFFSRSSGVNVRLATRDIHAFERVEIDHRCEIVEIDWEDIDSVKAACLSIDCVIHTAGPNAEYCRENPMESIQQRMTMVDTLIRAMRLTGTTKIVMLSTVHVYGNPLKGIINERSGTFNSHPYAMSHLAAERILEWCAKDKKVKCLILRLANCFGYPISSKTMDWSLLVPDIVQQAATTQKILLRGSGKDQRDFVTVSSLCGYLDLYIKGKISLGNEEENGYFEIVNFASGKTRMTIEIAEKVTKKVASRLGKPVNIKVNSKCATSLLDSLQFDNKKINRDYPLLSSDFENELEKLIDFCLDNA